jgi:hypothetical protein
MPETTTTPDPTAASTPLEPHRPGENEPGLPFFSLDTYGDVGLKRWGGYINEEDHPRLTGRQAMRKFREMAENDATVGAVLYVMRTLTLGVDFRFDPANESAEAREVQAFVESCIEDMAHTFDDFLSEVCSALHFGFAPFEKVYKVRRGPNDPDPRFRSKYADGRIGIRKLAIRAQTALDKWEFNEETGALLGMWQMAPPHYKRLFIPIEKMVLFRPSAPLNNPEGKSLLRPAFRAWSMLKRLQEIEAVGIERDLSGLPVMQVPLSIMLKDAGQNETALRQEFEKLVQKVRRDEREGVVVPAEEETDADGVTRKTGYKFGLLSTGGRRAVDVRPAIEAYQRDIARVMLAEFIFLGTDPNGSRSLADSKTTTFASALGAWLENIVATVQRYVIDPLVQLNGWPLDLAPRFEHGDIETPDLAAMADYVTKLVQTGVLTPDTDLERHLRAQGKLPELDTKAMPDTPTGNAMPPAPGSPVPTTAATQPEAGPGPVKWASPRGDPGPVPKEPTAPPPTPEAVADTAYNGAQVTSLLEVTAAVQAGTLPPAAAKAILKVAFRMPDASVNAIVDPLVPGSVKPAGPPAASAPPAPPPAG